MLEYDARKFNGSAATATAARTAPPRPLSPAAQRVAAQPAAPAYSPIVLAGTVRLLEPALIAIIGIAIYIAYVVPIDGFEWRYAVAIAGIAIMAMFSFQVADLYHVEAFRRLEQPSL